MMKKKRACKLAEYCGCFGGSVLCALLFSSQQWRKLCYEMEGPSQQEGRGDLFCVPSTLFPCLQQRETQGNKLQQAKMLQNQQAKDLLFAVACE
jgi:hypothetical protein